MVTREAACHCRQLRLAVEGDPWVVSICHCSACQRRTGSAFGMQAAFRSVQVEVTGRYKDFSRLSDEADRKEHVFHFCPDCGSQVFYTEPDEPDMVVVSVGAFADPTFPPPTESVYTGQRHPWVGLPEGIVHDDWRESWAPARVLYEAGSYAEAADRGRELLEAASHPAVVYNLACCESLAGRTDDALQHLRQAVAEWDGFRAMGSEDADFDPIRGEPAFKELIGG
jgi:hypothetical protein